MAENCVLASVYFCSKIVSRVLFQAELVHDVQGIPMCMGTCVVPAS